MFRGQHIASGSLFGASALAATLPPLPLPPTAPSLSLLSPTSSQGSTVSLLMSSSLSCVSDDAEEHKGEADEEEMVAVGKGRAKSGVWKHFNKPPPNEPQTHATCNVCPVHSAVRYRITAEGTTSHFIRHLKTGNKKHRDAYDKLQLPRKAELVPAPAPAPSTQTLLSFVSTSSSSSPSIASPTRDEDRELTLLLFCTIAETDSSFNGLTSSPSFRRMMQKYVGWAVPSRMLLTRALPDYYEQCVKGLRQELSRVDSISITTDSTFLTRHGQPYIAITAHWIDSGWQLHCKPLSIFPAQQCEDWAYITAQLKHVLLGDFNLDNRVHCIVTDEGKNFLKSAEEVQKLDVVRERIRCACHRIQLVFKEAIVQQRRGRPSVDHTLFNLLKRVQAVVLVFRNGWASTKKDVLRRWQTAWIEEWKTRFEFERESAARELAMADLLAQVKKAQEMLAAERQQEVSRKQAAQTVAQRLVGTGVKLHPSMKILEPVSTADDDDGSGSDADDMIGVEDEKTGSPVQRSDSFLNLLPVTKLTFQELTQSDFIQDYAMFDGNFDALADHIVKRRALISMCATRWMTYVEVADRFLTWHWAITKTMDEISLAAPRGGAELDWKLSAVETLILRQFVDVGRRAKQVLIRCEGSRVPTLSHLLHNYSVLRNIMLKRSTDDDQCAHIQAFCHEIAEGLLLKFDPVSDRTALLAAVLDPRYHELRFLGEDKADKEAKAIKKVAKLALKQEWEKRNLAASADLSNEPPTKRARHMDFDLEAEAGIKTGPSLVTEYENWFKMPDVQPDLNFDVLVWWKNHEMDYPLLATLARRYLSIPASSAPSERVFSRLKNIASEKRGRMKPSTLCQLLFVKHHLDKLNAE